MEQDIQIAIADVRKQERAILLKELEQKQEVERDRKLVRKKPALELHVHTIIILLIKEVLLQEAEVTPIPQGVGAITTTAAAPVQIPKATIEVTAVAAATLLQLEVEVAAAREVKAQVEVVAEEAVVNNN
jgi:hypothetical protein